MNNVFSLNGMLIFFIWCDVFIQFKYHKMSDREPFAYKGEIA
jgi:hypothetical protein